MAPDERKHRIRQEIIIVYVAYSYYVQRTAAARRREAWYMGCLSPSSYLTKRTAPLTSPRQRKALVETGKGMRPYAAKGWQGAASTSSAAPSALWTAVEVDALLCCLLLLRLQRSSGLWGVLPHHTHTHSTPTHALDNGPRSHRLSLFA